MGGPWNVGKVRRILTNIMYAGTLVYNKTTSKLKTPTRRNPVDQWVRTAGAIDPLVEQAVFDRAQEVRIRLGVKAPSGLKAFISEPDTFTTAPDGIPFRTDP